MLALLATMVERVLTRAPRSYANALLDLLVKDVVLEVRLIISILFPIKYIRLFLRYSANNA